MHEVAGRGGRMPPHMADVSRGRRKANRILRVPSVGTLAAGATSSPQTVKFVKAGEALALYGQISEATDVGAAAAAVRIVVGADRDIITDGNGATFCPFFALFGQARNWWPLGLEIARNEIWTFTFRNEHASLTYTPALLVTVWEDENG
jgi:hypothetical protein